MLNSPVMLGRAWVDHLEAADEQKILVVGPKLYQVLPQSLLKAGGVPVGRVLQLVTACLSEKSRHWSNQKDFSTLQDLE
jgi:hypothetical protein